MDVSVFQITLAALLSKSLTFCVALIAVFFMQVLYDRTNSVDQKRAFDKVEGDPRAVADYFGWRVLAFCVLGGLIFG